MTATHSSNTVWHHATVTRIRRERLNQHQSVVLWFTGLSGAGKSTLAHALEERLHQQQCRTFVLDGDNIRHGLCADLGFSIEDRRENMRRLGELSKLFIENGTIVLTAFISPLRVDRQQVRQLVGTGDFIEIHCNCDLETCEKRDVKGLYKRARAGEIQQFTGISSPYEPPKQPELRINTGKTSLQSCVTEIMHYLHQRGVCQLDLSLNEEVPS